MEWLEADGLGGFASGTALGVNTRRYHGLLLSATRPPADRRLLVNDAVVWLETPEGALQVSRHCYQPGITTESRVPVVHFESEPWPRFMHEGSGVRMTREIVVLHGVGVVLNRWCFSERPSGSTLCVRPLLSGRDFHANHRENPEFRFSGEVDGERIRWSPYPDLPRILSLANARFVEQPDWYRNFLYEAERARGLDALEDLATPGVLRFDLSDPCAEWILASDTPEARRLLTERSPREVTRQIIATESRRRARFATPLERAGDAYLVRRGTGQTVIAGYPWFGDWGRDTFIAMRGLCLATGRLAEARDILLAWSEVVDAGMLPNRFPDSASDAPAYNSVDAALWFATVVGEFLANPEAPVTRAERQQLLAALRHIIEGHLAGTRHGIKVASDGLLACGEPGVQLTWMDAKVGDWVVTPRIGKPVEIQALWFNALAVMSRFGDEYRPRLEDCRESFRRRFVRADSAALFDVVDADHETGKVDAAIRPNQVFAAGGLPVSLLDPADCRGVLDVVERHLWTPLGLRSLSPSHPDYRPHYAGGVLERDGAYHQGTVWPWLVGPFVEAWAKVHPESATAYAQARDRFIQPLEQHLAHAGLGHVSEVADGDPPHAPGGCPFQAWSVAELIRLRHRFDEP